MSKKTDRSTTKILVVKIGSSLLTEEGRGANENIISSLANQLTSIANSGIKILLVASGAVATGVFELGFKERPKEKKLLQAFSSVGQCQLISTFYKWFKNNGLKIGLLLVTYDDLKNRSRYLNIISTINTLFSLNVLPIINENDAVTTHAIQFKDNDTIAALLANALNADSLILLTDLDGIYDQDPRAHDSAQLIRYAKTSDKIFDNLSSSGGAWGRGGIYSKVEAAKQASKSGTTTIIANGRTSNVLVRIMAGEELGTILYPSDKPLNAKKLWILSQSKISGSLIIDNGAVTSISSKNRSLLPVGIIDSIGDYQKGDIVSCVDLLGNEVARGLVMYHAKEVKMIAGKSSGIIKEILNYEGRKEVIHKDNLVILDKKDCTF